MDRSAEPGTSEWRSWGHPRGRFIGRHSRSERGAALIEAAIVFMLLAMVAFGILEYGGLFAATIDVSAAAQEAARTGSATTTQPVADDQILQAVLARPGADRSDIEKVVIYRAAAGTTAPPTECLNTDLPPAGSGCNIYRSQDLALSASAIAGLPGAQGWPPSSRVPGVDYIGVFVQVKHTPLTGLVWAPSHFSDRFVMRLDPAATAPALAVAGPPAGFTNGTNVNPGWDDSWKAPTNGGTGGAGNGGVGGSA